jgi:hypothetical protein
MFAVAEVRRQEYLAAAAWELTLARARSARDPTPPWIEAVRWCLGGALVGAGHWLRGGDPRRPAPAPTRVHSLEPAGTDGAVLPAVGQPTAVDLEVRCPSCRRPVWPPPDLDAVAAVVTAEQVIRQHQRRPSA